MSLPWEFYLYWWCLDNVKISLDIISYNKIPREILWKYQARKREYILPIFSNSRDEWWVPAGVKAKGETTEDFSATVEQD